MRSTVVSILVAATLAACSHRDAVSAQAVPRIAGTIRIDGDWDEADWAKRALRLQFRGEDGELARPSSEMRLLRDGSQLLVALYAADENIVSADAFDVKLGALSLHADAAGKVVPAVPGLRAAVGYDEGTLDDPSDDDEEWVVELAIPISALGPGTHPKIEATRCDVPKDGVRRCSHWTGTVALD